MSDAELENLRLFTKALNDIRDKIECLLSLEMKLREHDSLPDISAFYYLSPSEKVDVQQMIRASIKRRWIDVNTELRVAVENLKSISIS